MRLAFSDFVGKIDTPTPTTVEFELLTPDGPVPYPFHDLDSHTTRRSVAMVWKARRPGRPPHCVVLAFDREGDILAPFVLWCGDGFLENKPRARGRDDELIELTRAGGGDVEAVTVALQQLTTRVHALAVDDPFSGCRFWKTHTCQHVEGVWHAMQRAGLTSRAIVDELGAAFQRYFSRSFSLGSVSRSADTIVHSTAFRRPVLLLGPRGAGKTSLARTIARTVQASYIEASGHEGVEAVDLFGSPVVGPDGRWLWKDGPLAEAFRRAARGERVVLCIDELLRIPVRHQSALLTALSPDHASQAGDPSGAVYRLRTGRIVDVCDDVGIEETLAAPCDRLAIVATSNIGADYHVSDLDPAIAGRFKLVSMTTTRESLEAALRATAAGRRLPDTVVAALLAFFDEANAHYAPESREVLRLRILPCTRTLAAVVNLSDSVGDIPLLLREEFPQWVTRDLTGALNANELALLNTLASRTVDHLAGATPIRPIRQHAA